MTVPNDPDALARRARERAEMIQGLYIHLMIYVVINIGLFGINWFTKGDDGVWWFYWPALTWLVFGLLIHGLVVVAPVFRGDWVDRKAAEYERRQSYSG